MVLATDALDPVMQHRSLDLGLRSTTVLILCVCFIIKITVTQRSNIRITASPRGKQSLNTQEASSLYRHCLPDF
jgi:hypothetical protein